MSRGLIGIFAIMVLAFGTVATATAHSPTSDPRNVGVLDEDDETDPARNIALPCENGVLPITPTPTGRSNHRIVHLANRCGIVGTDIEFQSRVDAAGKVRDYAFLGTMGAGLRIYDITDPANPTAAGAYHDIGWQNDVQVRGNLAVLTFDGVAGEPSTTSECMNTNHPEASGQGIDIIRLIYNRTTARFTTRILTCVPTPPGGAHNSTIHPSGRYIAISNSSSDWAVDIIDLKNVATVGVANGQNLHRFRLIDESRFASAGRCPTTGVTFKCLIMTKGAVATSAPVAPANSATGLFRPHDAHFSRYGNTMYVAALNSTFLINVSQLFEPVPLTQRARTTSIIPNILVPNPTCSPDGTNPLCDPHNITLSHQADVTSDGKILVVSDERGGGLTETGCNTGDNVLGGLHFFALAPLDGVAKSAGATHSNPKLLGHYFNPNPSLNPEPSVLGPIIAPIIARFPRTERGCTAHVFRLGGNGTSSPGSGTNGFDGVSGVPKYQLTEGWYGAGTWQTSFGGPSRSNDGIAEDPRSTWGNTLGWNVQPGADTWSSKEYKGFVYTGDMLRGMDVFTSTAGKDPVVTLLKNGPAKAVPGQRLSYRLTYRNVGPAPSSNATLTDVLPRGLSFVSASGNETWDPETRRIKWRLGTVPVGGTATLTVNVRVWWSAEPGTVIVNRADFRGDLTVSPTAYATTLVTSASAGTTSASARHLAAEQAATTPRLGLATGFPRA